MYTDWSIINSFSFWVYSKTENSLIEHAKEMRYGLQNAAEDITAMCTKIGTLNSLLIFGYWKQYLRITYIILF